MLLDLPTTRTEGWRWAGLEALPELAAGAAAGAGPDAKRYRIRSDSDVGAFLVFVDGVLDPGVSRLGAITIGATGAASGHPLGRLAIGAGWTLRVNADAAGLPVEIVHVSTGGANHLPASIVLAENAVASVTETFVGRGWANRLTRIELARSARLMRSVRLLQDDGFVSLREEVTVGQDASLTSVFLGAGSMGARIDGDVRLTGSAASAEIGGALLARGALNQECAIAVHHAAPNGQSKQVWRAVAADRSQVSLAARVEVARHAQKTDGEQSLRGLLLQRSATVNLKPELEIFADDVKCAHGATVGELDARALFYLESRGIEPGRAKALMTRAFVADALDRIGDDAVREAFMADADAWLETAL